jgi:hypothetical protein
VREQIEAVKEIWTKDKPEYHGEIVDFPPMTTWSKPVQKPHPPVIAGGASPRRASRDPLWRRDTPGGAERRLGQPRGVHAALAPDGRGGGS